MSKFFSLAVLVVGGIIVADILLHPAGTAAASAGIAGITTPSINGLLGNSTAATKAAPPKTVRG